MNSPNSKTQILAQFQQLLAQHKQTASQVATKEEEAEKAKNQELLSQAATYTVDSIVNGMATLQLNFGSAITELAQRLGSESGKLDELKRAILVEQDNLQQLRKVRIVADALYILRQEHQTQLRTLSEEAQTQQEALAKEISQTRKLWEQEQAEFTSAIEEKAAQLIKEREQELADYTYQVQQQRKIELDEYEQAKRLQERTLQELNREKEKDWQEREQLLSINQAEFEANEQKIAGFEEALKQGYTEAKGEAIKKAEREAKVKSDLLEKEWEAEKQGYEFKLTSLEATIQRQLEQMAELTTQLQTATNQAQTLAMRAFQSSNSPQT
ncbi:hypothetical protein K4A83_15250 [Spirulina subsalsa FACHB-351]|uniref:Myosin heavy chain n=1 Tax=Spirulina subsalsa FACHB-351 TaxID=234711 RepID=A0ABT3L7X7_9CYAN|nr:hypothetical protein [Spirulina subsalsa]MCW6037621.1 hypothetical protein [Spirulina subsalsa FACHB-351]